ncbi:MAG: DegT/DnrJ/EryC1/StrS family aminotransferase [Desulfarculus sp.]|nr:DegT/DnrJ/EryC1/StrS family aminotransferase [Desulfarculus sp.]
MAPQRTSPSPAGQKMTIPISRPHLDQREERYLLEALRSTWISSTGPFVERFEEDLAAYLGLPHAVSTTNGTAALHLALATLGIGPGDEVLIPNLTFAATGNAVYMTGARPVLVDSRPGHWNLDPDSLAGAITPRCKALIVVHLLGHACPMEPILAIARRHGLLVVEDCAEALGCTDQGRRVGGFGHIGAFSFFANKVMTTGEGGACVTSDPALFERLQDLRAHGMARGRQYWHQFVGFNYRMTNLSAALGVAQLEKLDHMLQKRREVRRLYDRLLGSLPGIRINFEAPGQTIDWLYPLFLDQEALGLSRDQALASLREAGIDARPMFYPLHLMPPFAEAPRANGLGNSTRWGLSGLLLPLYPDMEPAQVEYVAGQVAALAAGA